MARSKQATPMRREVSSEYVSKHDRVLRSGKEDGDNDNNEATAMIDANGEEEKKKKTTNGEALPASKPATSTTAVTRTEGSIVTLIIDVAGIYVSL